MGFQWAGDDAQVVAAGQSDSVTACLRRIRGSIATAVRSRLNSVRSRSTAHAG